MSGLDKSSPYRCCRDCRGRIHPTPVGWADGVCDMGLGRYVRTTSIGVSAHIGGKEVLTKEER